MKLKGVQHWSLPTKIIAVAVSASLPLGAIVAFYVVPLMGRKVYDEKLQATKQVVNVAYAVMKEQDARREKGECSLQEAQHKAVELIGTLRYNENDYFWINDLTPTMIMHPFKPALNGKDLTGNTDPEGKHLFVEMADVCRKNGEGAVAYMWPKPGVDKPVPKISYVQLYKPWGWIVGSGIYIEDVEAEVSSLRWKMLAATFIALALAAIQGVLLGRFIRRPILTMIRQMDNADINTQLNSGLRDETGMLSHSFDKFVASIRGTLEQVAESSAAVASASSQISSSAEEMAAGAREQTGQAGEVAGAVEQMVRTIEENSKNAGITADTAREAKGAAEEGGHVVAQTIDGMRQVAEVVRTAAAAVRDLGASSEQIGTIIGVIDDIADQTNLLALNAAIEAARAGEQGRGFAVVADEVRKLAERTTHATKEITGMIRKIQTDTRGAVASMDQGTQRVDDGIRLADQAGVSLKRIVDISQQVTDMVTRIAAANEEQSATSEHIAKNVEAISAVTGETASATQQIARAAEDLNRLTDDLERTMEKFRLAKGEPGGAVLARRGPVVTRSGDIVNA